ncbi:MAG TPA: response regulator [Pirellulaceae bacterium]|jgi:FixJ family two-component response regulator
MPATLSVTGELRPTDSGQATVFIVDDQEDIRTSTAVLVRSTGLETECFDSGRAFLDAYDGQKHGCIVLDYQMPELNGAEVQQALKSREFRSPIIFITGKGDVSFATAAMREGALDVLIKPFAAEDLLTRIQEAVQIDLVQRQKRTLVSDVHDRLSRLTRREREIAELLASGESCKQIARQLEICHKTVDNHQTTILEKLSVDNPTQLARMFAQLDLH